jgi:cbb3-type cytochrome oxidase maturation protein
MEVIFIVLPLALALAGAFLAAFLWAVNRGQYDDLDTPPVRVLFDDTPTTTPAAAPVPVPAEPSLPHRR